MATAYQWGGAGREDSPVAGQKRIPERGRPQLLTRAASRGKKPALVEFCTVKKIDNSRLVRHVEPVKLRNLYKTVALGSLLAGFFMLYIYQHFRCIDQSFLLEDLRSKQEQAQTVNSKLKLEIATLRDPHRIDVIARHQLGLTQPTANQLREYTNVDGAEVAAVQYVRPNRAP